MPIPIHTVFFLSCCILPYVRLFGQMGLPFLFAFPNRHPGQADDPTIAPVSLCVPFFGAGPYSPPPRAALPNLSGFQGHWQRPPWAALWHKGCKVERKSRTGIMTFLSGTLCPTPKYHYWKPKSLENRSFQGFLELLGRFELPTSSLPSGKRTFF